MAIARTPDLWENPLGTDGFEFVEYAAPDPAALGRLFEQMGFVAVAKHRSKNVLLYRQGDVNFIVNAEPDSFAQSFARVHGPCICAIAFRVADAAQGLPQVRRVRRLGRRGASGSDGAQHPGDQGHRRLADLPGRPLSRRAGDTGAGVSIYDIDFVPLPGVDQHPRGRGTHLPSTT